jgi:hypothetical protein
MACSRWRKQIYGQAKMGGEVSGKLDLDLIRKMASA